MPLSRDPELDEEFQRRRRASAPDARHVLRLRRVAVGAGIATALVGVVVLVGWLTGVEALTRVLPQFVTTKFWTAVGCVAIGAGLVALSWSRERARPRAFSWQATLVVVCAFFVIVLAVLMMVEDAMGATWGWDNPFGLDPVAPSRATMPGRLATGTQASFILLGLSQLGYIHNRVWQAQLACGVASMVGMLAMLGYLFRVESLYSIAIFSSMALPTSLAVTIAGIGGMCVRPNRGVMRLVVGNTAGGALARRLLPAALLGPLLLALTVEACVRAGVLDPDFGEAVLLLSVITLGVGLVIYQSYRLRAVDLRRAGAEELLGRARTAERARDQALGELRQANQDLEDFAVIAAHRLKEPLVAIGMYARAMGGSPAVAQEPAAAAAVDRMLSSTRQGSSLVDDLLAFSRAAKDELTVKPVDLNAVAGQVAAEQVAAAGRGRVDVDRSLPCVRADRSQVVQLLVNLVGNALHHCPGDRDPQVRLEPGEVRDGLVTVLVHDNGHGVPEDERELIFEMFQRGSHEEDDAGSGVGLSICRRIVERQGGRLTLVESSSQGSTFAFTLPGAD